ncbi:MAG: hypothetical protein IIA66_09500 [Planctomycetes bacterium]|nr:hypothetical protein [Planctomycetota bacterium]
MKRFILPYLVVFCAWCWIVDAQALADGFTIGGAVYTDLDSPITSGLAGVEVCVECGDEFIACDITAGPWGGWDLAGVPAGSCRVTPTLPGWCFSHVEGGVIGEPAPITIIVGEDQVGENLSLQFLGTTGTSYCCVVAEDCDDGEACTVDECFDCVCASAPNDCPVDFDCDGFVGAPDLALLLGNWGSCPECEADLDGDGEVGASDLAILLGSWGPCQ